MGSGKGRKKTSKGAKQQRSKRRSAETLICAEGSENRLAEENRAAEENQTVKRESVDEPVEQLSEDEKLWSERGKITKWITFLVMLALGIIIAVSCYKSYQIAQNDNSVNADGTEIKHVVESIILQNENSDKRIDVIMETMILCTNQLEDYDKSNLNAGMSCIGFIGLIITAVGAITAALNEKNRVFFNQAVSVILLFIPEMFVVFLYNFSMSCRRSAIYRGYLMFLEEILNEELGADYMLFNQLLIPERLSNFSVNTKGPVILALFILIIVSLFFILSYYFARQSKKFNFFCWYNAFFFSLCSLCIGCSIWYGACLTTNGNVIYSTKALCEKTLNEWNMNR